MFEMKKKIKEVIIDLLLGENTEDTRELTQNTCDIKRGYYGKDT